MGIFELTWIAFIVANAIYALVSYSYFTSIFNLRYRASVTVVVCVLLAFANLFFVHANSPILNIAVSLATHAIFILFFAGSIKNRIVFALLLYLAGVICEYISGYSTVFIANIPIEQIQFGTPEFLYGLLLTRTFHAVFAIAISSVASKRTSPKLKTSHWIALIASPIGSLFVLYNFLLLRVHSMADMVSSMIVVVTTVIAITVYRKILADYEVEAKISLLEKQINYYSYQCFLAEESEKLIRRTKHDIKNLLLGFQSDIQNKEIENVQNRISKLLGDIESLDGPAKSGNLAVDSIINYKADAAKKRNVHFSLNLKIPQNLLVDSIAICQILGSALDNAIEATEKIDDIPKRVVQISMSINHGVLFLEVINPYHGDIVTDTKGRIMSSKRGFRMRGIGLESIRGAISDGQGSVGIDYRNGQFRLFVTLYSVREA